MSAAWGRVIVHVATPLCTAPLPLGPPQIRSSSKSKRIMPGELLHWWSSAPPVVVNCQSGVTPTPSQPQGVDDGGAGEATVAGRSTDTRIMNSFIVSATVDECVYPAHQGGTSQCGAYEQVQPHGAKEWGSVGGAAWRRRRERRRRERTGAEAGRMLRCVWVRLSTTQLRRSAARERRGAETGVVQAAWCGGRGAAGRLAAAARAPRL